MEICINRKMKKKLSDLNDLDYAQMLRDEEIKRLKEEE